MISAWWAAMVVAMNSGESLKMENSRVSIW